MQRRSSLAGGVLDPASAAEWRQVAVPPLCNCRDRDKDRGVDGDGERTLLAASETQIGGDLLCLIQDCGQPVASGLSSDPKAPVPEPQSVFLTFLGWIIFFDLAHGFGHSWASSILLGIGCSRAVPL